MTFQELYDDLDNPRDGGATKEECVPFYDWVQTEEFSCECCGRTFTIGHIPEGDEDWIRESDVICTYCL